MKDALKVVSYWFRLIMGVNMNYSIIKKYFFSMANVHCAIIKKVMKSFVFNK